MSFSTGPKLLKGAIVGFDIFNPLASLIPFQYNPDKLTRKVNANATHGVRNQGEVLRLNGPPHEVIDVEIEFDATDDLEASNTPGNAIATVFGVHPKLASLEMLLYPKSALMIANEVLAQLGVIEVIPPAAPLTFFFWGIKRVVPVRITAVNITEEAFDTDLNPIRAHVNLSMDVLTYQDLGLLSLGGAAFLAHQIIKEGMATINGLASIAGAGSASISGSIKIG
jgi:hypothetical protein